MKLPWSDDDAVAVLTEAAERASALAIGPGLGRSDSRRALVRELLTRVDLPAVVNADALFALEPVERDAATILTPHAGELAACSTPTPPGSTSTAWRQLGPRRTGSGRRCSSKVRTRSVVSQDGAVMVCDAGPPSLATAGTGDVLTGVVGAFLSKGLEPSTAAAAAALAHRREPRRAHNRLVASNLLELLPAAVDG